MNTIPADPLLDWAPGGLSLCLIQAARLALDRQAGVSPACKPDGTLVTPADTDIEHMLEAFLKECLPDNLVVGEETLDQKGREYLRKALRGKTWVIDPVDGTVLFAMGMPGWGISLGYMESGVLVHGVVVYPTRTIRGDHLQFIYSAGTSAVMRAETLLPAEGPLSDSSLGGLLESAEPLRQLPAIAGYPGLFAISQRVAKQALYKGKHPVVSLGSCVSTFRHLMDGGIVAYIVKLKLWDVAAVLPLAWRLGVKACLLDGTPLSLNVLEAGWVTDPASPHFLALTDHVLYYRTDRASPAMLQDFTWPKAE